MPTIRKKTAKEQLIELRNGGRPLEELIAERFERGLSPRKIAPELDMHFTSIYDFANDFGLKPPGRKKVEETAGAT